MLTALNFTMMNDDDVDGDDDDGDDDHDDDDDDDGGVGDDADDVVDDEDGRGCMAAQFHPRNGCLSVDDRDRAGWSSMCYAAINGNPQLMTRLLELHGDPNDRTHQGKAEAFLPKHLPLVSLCTYFCNNEALKILLEAHANPNQRDARKLDSRMKVFFPNA